MGFGDRLKDARKKAGLTQKEFAAKLNTSAQNLAQYETGKRVPKKETLTKLAKALGLSFSYAHNGEAYFYCFVDTTDTDSENAKFNAWQYNDAAGQQDKGVYTPVSQIKNKKTFSDTMDEIGSRLNDAGQEKVIEYSSDIAEIPKYQKNKTE